MRRHSFLLALVSAAGLLLGANALAEEASDQHEGFPGTSEWCTENPGKCEEARAKHAAFCKENPEKCAELKEKRAERQAWCKENPEACAEKREKYKQRRAELKAKCEADPAKCEEMKQARRERFKQRHGGGSAPSDPAAKPGDAPSAPAN